MEDARSIPCSYHVEIPARQTEPEKIWRWLSGLKRKQRSVETENEGRTGDGARRLSLPAFGPHIQDIAVEQTHCLSADVVNLGFSQAEAGRYLG